MRKEGNKSRSNLYKNEVDLNVNVRKQKQNMLLEIENWLIDWLIDWCLKPTLVVFQLWHEQIL